jgi:phosphatidylglycerol:prolipoprotein diacylglycerol transferase
LAGFVTCYLAADYLAKRNLILIPREKVSDFITFGALGTLIGGRLGYVLFYKPELITSISANFPFWGALEVHKGGMASHGGIIGIMLACWWFARKEKISVQHVIDIAAFGGAIAVFYGRIANYINGELYGRVAPDGTSWAVKFPTEILTWGPSETEKMKSLGPAVVGLGQTTLAEWSSWISDWPMHRRSIEDAVYALVEATHQGNEAVLSAIGPALSLRYPSQLIQAGLEGFLVAVILLVVWMKPRKPGVVSGAFGLSYSIARIIGEQYRLPDAHIGFELLGLTRGQWLSVGLVLFAVGYLVYALKQEAEPIGGWCNKKF